MIAKIKTADGIVYNTVVFAYIPEGWNSSIIGFDPSYESIQFIPIFGTIHPYITQQIFIFEASRDGWIKDGSIEGYDWIVGDKKRLEHIRQGHLLPPDVIARCQAMQDALNLPEWVEIADSKTINDLMWASGGFHDGEILSVTKEERDATIVIDAWGCKIHIRLENAEISPNCTVGYGRMGEILDSSIFFENGRIYWVDDYGFESIDQLSNEFGYFSGTRMFWKIELN